MFYEPRNGHGLRYDPFKAIVAPRPIGWISTLHENGTPNLAPFSFFSAIASVPPMVCFTSEGLKDSFVNARDQREFVCNLSTYALRDQMNESSRPLPPGEDEFLIAGLTKVASSRVKPPRVGESPAALECIVTQSFELERADGSAIGRHMVIGEVVGVYIDDSYIRDGRFDTLSAHPLARCGYRDYAAVMEIFEMPPLSRGG
jgi:flavin reductase (DIM6/NTAB) family NADH-FMN oxidoreductase RutF